MIKLINSSLFVQTTESRTSDKGDYFLTTFRSAVKTPDPKNKDTKIAKTIASVIHSEEDNFNQENTRISIGQTKAGYPAVHIGQNANNRFDTNVYLIAIPYSGVMEPLEKTHDYRIYRGTTIRAEKRTIDFEGQKYNKIAFLTIVLNESLFKEDNEHHQDELVLTLNSFNLENGDSDSDEKITVKTTVTVTFRKDEEPEVSTTSEETEPIDIEKFKGVSIFPLYQGPQQQQQKSFEKKDGSSDEKSAPKKTFTPEEKRQHYDKPLSRPVTTKSLDEMIAESSKVHYDKMDDYRDSRGGRKNYNGKRGKGGKKGKRR
jgi:hypothetical protein